MFMLYSNVELHVHYSRSFAVLKVRLRAPPNASRLLPSVVLSVPDDMALTQVWADCTGVLPLLHEFCMRAMGVRTEKNTL